ncbi:MAG: hypothetical protein PHR16_02125 [Methylovulum sp.]|nr:hypothetical protein [Methylovulum sp.]
MTARKTPDTLDGRSDGDLDAFIGEYYGDINYIENTGTASAPVFTSLINNPFGINGKGDPTFVDIDHDGDIDAFLGSNDGHIGYLENIGTATAPAFAPGVKPFGITDVGDGSQSNLCRY